MADHSQLYAKQKALVSNTFNQSFTIAEEQESEVVMDVLETDEST